MVNGMPMPVIFQIEFYQPGHDNKGLPHQKGEKSSKQCSANDVENIDDELRLDNFQICNPIIAIILHYIKRFFDQLRDLKGENLGNHGD